MQLAFASSLTFDEWTDKRRRKFIGITIRSLIDGNYEDFFLDLVCLSFEVNNSDALSSVIKASLLKYRINVDDIISCSTDNCNLMNLEDPLCVSYF